MKIISILFILSSFQIIFSQSITVTVTSPNGGEILRAGLMKNITWNHTGTINNVDIHYTTNYGVTWQPITIDTQNVNSFPWTIPSISSATVKIRVMDSSSPSILDTSNANFRIINPNITSSPVKILPLGNSITLDQLSDEFRYTQNKISYRYFLWNALRTENYNTDFIGDRYGGYYNFPDPENNGVPGINDDEVFHLLKTGEVKVDGAFQMQATAGPYFDYYLPDIVLLHIGTNGIDSSSLDVKDILEFIDSTAAAKGKEIWVMLALIISSKDNKAIFTEFNNNVRAMAEGLIEEGHKIIIVDMQNEAGLIVGDYEDNLHPNDNGKLKMASLWFSKLKLILPDPDLIAPVITTNPDTAAYVGLPYWYNVDASGSGAPNYSLSTSPPGMTVNPKTGIVKWTPTVTGTVSVSIDADNSVGTDNQSFDITVMPAPILTSDLISFWQMDNVGVNSTLEDFPGINNGNCTDCPVASSGIVNGAFNFNGSSNMVEVLDDSSLYFGIDTSFTIEAWINKQGGSGEQAFIGKYRAVTRMYYSLGVDASNKIKFLVRDHDGPAETLTSTAAIANDSWHHVVAIVDAVNDSIKLFVDGVRISKSAGMNREFFSWDPLTIGHFRNEFLFNGKLDELAMYRRVLTQSEVTDHYNRGKLYGKGYFEQFVLAKLKVFLEGPYSGSTMNTNLTVPLTSPYAEDPRTVSNIPADVVDWVLVELRSTPAGSAMAYRSAFLKNNGSIVGDDGVSDIPLDVASGDYHIVIKHRNHLAVMSSGTESLSLYPEAATLYNFTTGQLQAYGTDPMKDLSGAFGMIAGDANADGQVNALDRNETWDLRNQTGYLFQDVDLDGQVNALDRNITWDNRNKASQLP